VWIVMGAWSSTWKLKIFSWPFGAEGSRRHDTLGELSEANVVFLEIYALANVQVIAAADASLIKI
jgi:hypothetical protein